MHSALPVVATCAAVPLACLGLLMWLAWLEDTLEDSVRKSVRRPAPEPILAIPVRRPTIPAVPAPVEPAPVLEPVAALEPAAMAEPRPTPVVVPVTIPVQRRPSDVPAAMAEPQPTPAEVPVIPEQRRPADVPAAGVPEVAAVEAADAPAAQTANVPVVGRAAFHAAS